MEDASHLEPIPHPPGHLLVGNLLDLDAAHPMEGLAELARKYGPIYRLEVPGLGSRIVVSSFELVDPLCDESQFDKNVGGGLRALASGPAGRGLSPPRHRTPTGARRTMCFCPLSAWTQCAATSRACSISRAN